MCHSHLTIIYWVSAICRSLFRGPGTSSEQNNVPSSVGLIFWGRGLRGQGRPSCKPGQAVLSRKASSGKETTKCWHVGALILNETVTLSGGASQMGCHKRRGHSKGKAIQLKFTSSPRTTLRPEELGLWPRAGVVEADVRAVEGARQMAWACVSE